MDETLTGTTTPNQSGPRSNGNEGVTPYSPEFQKRSLTIIYHLVLYTRYSFLSGISNSSASDVI